MSLTRLIYTSRRLDRSEVALEAIVQASQRNNQRDQVTGALVVSEEYFAQVLEGSREAVSACLARVIGDPRHGSVQIVSAGEVHHRVFPGWNMRPFGEAELRAIISKHYGALTTLQLLTLSQIALEDLFRQLAVLIGEQVERPPGPLAVTATEGRS